MASVREIPAKDGARGGESRPEPAQRRATVAEVRQDDAQDALQRGDFKSRAYGTVSLSLSEAKTVGKARHATINDVVLSLCAGALRRYLSERQALPQAALLAAVPVSLRLPGDSRLNNQTVFTLCRLATDIPDALARLSTTCVGSQGAKTLFAEVRDALTTELSLYGAPIVVTGLARLMAMTRAANVLPVMYNVVISNVPGPRKPIYCNGAPAQHYFPLSIPYHGCALNITVQSYRQSRIRADRMSCHSSGRSGDRGLSG